MAVKKTHRTDGHHLSGAEVIFDSKQTFQDVGNPLIDTSTGTWLHYIKTAVANAFRIRDNTKGQDIVSIDTDADTIKFGTDYKVLNATPLRTVLALADSATVPTGAELVDSGMFTSASTASRIRTTDTAVNIIASMLGAVVGSYRDFTIVNTVATYTETLAVGTGVTLVGDVVVLPLTSGTFRIVMTASATVSIYRL